MALTKRVMLKADYDNQLMGLPAFCFVWLKPSFHSPALSPVKPRRLSLQASRKWHYRQGDRRQSWPEESPMFKVGY